MLLNVGSIVGKQSPSIDLWPSLIMNWLIYLVVVQLSVPVNCNNLNTNVVIRRNVMEEILRSIKNLQENCQQWTSRPLAEDTFMESLASRLSLTEAKLDTSISNLKLIEKQQNLENRLSLVERLIENNFDRLAKKFEELSETLRGLQTMVIINHNSTEDKIKRLLNSVVNPDQQSSSFSGDSVNDLKAFLEVKLINTEKLIGRHVTLVKDEIKEIVSDAKMKGWSNELTTGADGVDSVDVVGTFNQLRADVVHKVDKIENQIKFANQEINFKLDSQIEALSNLTDSHLFLMTSFASCNGNTINIRNLGESRSTGSTSSSIRDQLMVTNKLSEESSTFNGTNDVTIPDSSNQVLQVVDYSESNHRCLIRPNKTSMDNCDSIPFKSTWKTCADIYSGNITCDGIYLVMVEPRPSRVWCDMNDNGGGWMVILRRGNFDNKPNNLISFNQNWFLYKYGFGDQKDEYWLGNEYVHRLTHSIPHQLQIDLESYDGQCISLDYGHFQVDSDEKAYRLIVADARGPHAVIGEQLLLYNNSAFNTRDRINDRNSLRCGHFNGGWWFNSFACYQIFLTGELIGPDDYKGQLPGIHWYSWKPNKPLKSVQMKIRPIRQN